jgi:hypothetical protein
MYGHLHTWAALYACAELAVTYPMYAIAGLRVVAKGKNSVSGIEQQSSPYADNILFLVPCSLVFNIEILAFLKYLIFIHRLYTSNNITLISFCYRMLWVLPNRFEMYTLFLTLNLRSGNLMKLAVRFYNSESHYIY